jgi:hypothetical protein
VGDPQRAAAPDCHHAPSAADRLGRRRDSPPGERP